MKPKTFLHHKSWTLRLFEWVVLSCIVLVLIALFLRYTRQLQAQAERLKVQATVENLRAAVFLATVLHKYSEDTSAAARPGGNPVALVHGEKKLVLHGYLGELEGMDPSRITPGHWYYDRLQGALIYRLRNTAGFQSSLAGPARIRLCLRGTDIEKSHGIPIKLEACENYRWLPPE